MLEMLKKVWSEIKRMHSVYACMRLLLIVYFKCINYIPAPIYKTNQSGWGIHNSSCCALAMSHTFYETQHRSSPQRISSLLKKNTVSVSLRSSLPPSNPAFLSPSHPPLSHLRKTELCTDWWRHVSAANKNRASVIHGLTGPLRVHEYIPVIETRSG